MLRVDTSTLGPFGLTELEALVKAKGWEAMLPGALSDAELLQLSDQLVDFLRNDGLAMEPRRDRAAMSMTLRLLIEAGAKHQDFVDNLPLYFYAMMALEHAVDREIAKRVTQRESLPADSELMQVLRDLVSEARSKAAA
ncbi:hypothetical protein [Ottowia thiooxydans]|uniref:hypothetical protein n=1 Tax=Ottowia thiooxydans TaxID=219182 RepID=UPI0003FEB392|nr:hypothetical protein [Ottowia thiooxydans]